MKKILVMLVVLMLFSCGDDNNNPQGILGWKNAVNKNGIENNYKTVVLDGCQYIVYDAGSGYSGNGFMAHKGNCNSDFHKINK